MRPVETVLTGADTAEAGEEVEQQCLLVGLRGVLPLRSGALEIRKPRPYALKLQADETQQAQAALLEQLLAAETRSKPVARPEKSRCSGLCAGRCLRSCCWPSCSPPCWGTRLLPAPALPADPNAPFNRFYQTVSALPESALVLVVTDYPPGFAGELEQAAVPVLTHLTRKNARLAFLSTSPISLDMGERLLARSRTVYIKNGQTPPPYTLGQDYLFLGYLPGGAAGVKGFAEQPQKMTGVDPVSGDLWQTDMLRGRGRAFPLSMPCWPSPMTRIQAGRG